MISAMRWLKGTPGVPCCSVAEERHVMVVVAWHSAEQAIPVLAVVLGAVMEWLKCWIRPGMGWPLR